MKSKIFIIMLVTAVLMYIPYLNVFFKVFNTLFHEGGHAIAALFMKGDVLSISLFSNTEGVTTTSSSSWFAMLATSLFGYVFAAIVGLLFAWLWKSGKHKTILLSIALFSFVNLVFWVRNLYGIIWLVISCILLIGLLVKIKKDSVLSVFSLILTIVLITQSLLSSLDILMLSYATPNEAGDATNLSKLTFIPSLIWGVLFFMQSAIISFFSFRFLWKTKESNNLLRKR